MKQYFDRYVQTAGAIPTLISDEMLDKSGCKKCQFQVEGECRRHPPTGYRADGFLVFAFPSAVAQCGEYKVKR